MNNTKRIHIDLENTVEKHIKFKLEQDIDKYEILSLNLSQKDIYQAFNADFGVLVGRVIANGGIGIPNAKISIFIPIDDDDKENEDILALYPYETPRDKNNDGKRYNLLPRVGRVDSDGIVSPKQPFGSFPIKEEILANDTILEVFKKYYKYTTVTNNVGDYMIYGVPIGVQTTHMSVDVTDIGNYSMNPASMIKNLGFSENLFYDDGITIKPSNDLEDLPHIETQEISVNVIPFWGDSENFDIGITRQDFRIKAQLVNTFTIFGTAFTDAENTMWTKNWDQGDEDFREYYRLKGSVDEIGMKNKRTGTITEKIYYYPDKYSDTDIDNGDIPSDKMLILSSNEYTIHKSNGDFVFIINSNRNKYIINEYGNEIKVPNDYDGGVYKNFRGFITFEITKEDLGYSFNDEYIGKDGGDDLYAKPFRYKLKFPQKSGFGASFDDTEGTNTINWRKEDYNFESSYLYSVAKFHGTVFNDNGPDYTDFPWREDGSNFGDTDATNSVHLERSYFNVGIIGLWSTNENDNHQFPSNCTTYGNNKVFGGNWLNFCIHFPQIGYITESSGNWKSNWDKFAGIGSNTNFVGGKYYYKYFYHDNEQPIAATDVNTKWFARSDLHHTDFIKIDKDVIIDIANVNRKGFTFNNIGEDLQTKIRDGDFRNGEYNCPYNGGKENGNPENGIDDNYYFYKGFGDSNCIEFLISLGLV